MIWILREKTISSIKYYPSEYFGELKWLFRTYPIKEIISVFVERPVKIYTFSSYNFCKNILLGLEDIKLKEEKYVKTPKIF